MNNSKLEQLQSDFIATVSHELRTPLTSIRGFADTLITSGNKLSDEQKIKFLNIIKEQSNRLINLVENLLSVTDTNILSEKFVIKSVDVKKSLDVVISVVKQKYRDYDFNLNLDKYLETILVDKDKFEQVLLNIIENACKYSPSNKNIEISAKNIKTDLVEIIIKDYGIGISEKDSQKIFDKFTRIESPITQMTQGSGLGLYLAKKITEKMDGTIIYQKDKIGSSFILKFQVSTLENQAATKLKGNVNA